MPTLHVALQEGFVSDRVVITLNGAEAANRPAVTTRNQIGFAESVEVEAPAGAAEIHVDVPTRGLSASAQVKVEGMTTYVGVSIEDGRLNLHQQREAFRYL
jgi:hypothetical protein